MSRQTLVSFGLTFVCVALRTSQLSAVGTAHPNIVIIIADDMGWNDVGFHGSNQIPTPNIDALAYNGVILNRHYTLPTCTPSRTAFLTGKYPMGIGMQGKPIRYGEPRGVPLDVATLPHRLKQLGYVTRIIGKWHLGSFRTEYTPTRRGFDSFLGYWHGYIGYFNHSINFEDNPLYNGLDFHRNLIHTAEFEDQYATEVFTNESVRIIADHDTSRPLYLHIAHLAVHSGINEKPLEVPDERETYYRFRHIESPDRRMYAGMLHELDQSVGRVMRALSDKGIINNTIVVFLSDNGAPTTGLYKNHGSNWPLRGIKDSLHEGALRTVAALWSSQLQQPGRVSSQLFHISDWLPTLYSAAGGNVTDLGDIDGVDQWRSLAGTKSFRHPRSQALLNIDERLASEGLIDGKWKMAKFDPNEDKHGGFYGASGLGKLCPSYTVRDVISSVVNTAISRSKKADIKENIHGPGLDFYLDRERILELRAEATIGCQDAGRKGPIDCSRYCLYDIDADPCETVNLASANPGKLSELMGVLNEYRAKLVPQLNKPSDPAANPIFHKNRWVSWLDDNVH